VLGVTADANAPHDDQRLQNLAEVFAACRTALTDTVELSHWRPADGSAAKQHAAALPHPDPAVADPVGVTGFLLVSEAVSTFLLVAAGHLGALAALHACREVHFSPGVLVRAVLENCAHAMWVLGRPGEGPEDLLARAYLEEYLSAEEAKKNAGRMGDKTAEAYQDAAAAYKRLRIEIQARFPGVTPADLAGPPRRLAGQELPGPEGGVKWMYELLSAAAGSSMNERTAMGVYGYLSNITHPTLYPVRQMRDWIVAPGHEGHATSEVSVDVDFLVRQGTVAVLAFYNALSYVTSYFGWQTGPHDALTAAIDRTLPGAITP